MNIETSTLLDDEAFDDSATTISYEDKNWESTEGTTEKLEETTVITEGLEDVQFTTTFVPEFSETNVKTSKEIEVSTTMYMSITETTNDGEMFHSVSEKDNFENITKDDTIVFPVFVEEVSDKPFVIQPDVIEEDTVDREDTTDPVFHKIDNDEFSEFVDSDNELNVSESELLEVDSSNKVFAVKATAKDNSYVGNLIPHTPIEHKKSIQPLYTVISLPGYNKLRQPLVLQYPGMVTATITRVQKSYSWQ